MQRMWCELLLVQGRLLHDVDELRFIDISWGSTMKTHENKTQDSRHTNFSQISTSDWVYWWNCHFIFFRRFAVQVGPLPQNFPILFQLLSEFVQASILVKIELLSVRFGHSGVVPPEIMEKTGMKKQFWGDKHDIDIDQMCHFNAFFLCHLQD